MSPHPIEPTTAPVPRPPQDLQRLFERAFACYQMGAEYQGVEGEWYAMTQDGVIYLRKHALNKWPEHDKSPQKKLGEKNG